MMSNELKGLAAVVFLFVVGIFCQADADSGLVTRRTASASEIQKLLQDGSTVVPAGTNEGLLVVYYRDEQTRVGFAKQTDPRYKAAIRDMQIFDVVCFVSVSQHVKCLRPGNNAAGDVTNSLTPVESDALMQGFRRACACAVGQEGARPSVTSANSAPSVKKEQARPETNGGVSIDYAELYADAMSNGLAVGKRYRFRAVPSTTDTSLFLHNPDFPNGPLKLLQVNAAFDDQSNYRDFLKTNDTGPRTIVASMGAGGRLRIHGIY